MAAQGGGFFEIFKEMVNAAAGPVFGGAYHPFDPGWEGRSQLFIIASTAINLVLGFVGLLFFIFLIVAGFQWMTAGGSEETLEAARGRIKNAVIGLLIVVLAFVISYVISAYVVSLVSPEAVPGGVLLVPPPQP
ncbi:MAG: pilin [bacterium]|nr:pilin [bacterium]